MCVLFVQDHVNRGWKEFGRTEIIWNNLNPDFVQKFVMKYRFEELQKLKFEIYDVDCKSPDLSKHDFLGSTECTLGEIITSNKIAKRLAGPKKDSGSIIINAEEQSSCKERVTLHFCGHKLDKKDFFGKSDPFLSIYRVNEDQSFTLVHRTEVIKKTLDPTWKPFSIPVRSLCNGDYDRVLKFECYDWDADGGHDFIGEFKTNLRELSRGPSERNKYECINPKKAAKKQKYKNSGVIEMISCKIEQVFTFLDYVRGGTGIHCTFGIDFTASNGDPKDSGSLHYMSQFNPSQYGLAIKAVGDIIKDYDTHQMFPALGFGARLPPDGVVSHEFALNGNPANPYCHGIDGVLQAYQRTLTSVQLYGPTNFAPCINHVAKFARTAAVNGNDYFILLIVTDGIITDMPQTCEAIVQAAKLPMSIIIIGVGDADFGAMEVLDGDEIRLSSKGVYAERDIVQFVPMREFMGRGGQDRSQIQSRLAQSVLEEIPDQFLSYMHKRSIKPHPPVQRHLSISSLDSLPNSERG
ncbi:copine-8 [Patella vulgata]|uniref:copine-8 n=1 Tax=Patella vulgata TaxID=6465 RepID=UPI0024A7DEFF|nr:copine-8 [Patella vulgata]